MKNNEKKNDTRDNVNSSPGLRKTTIIMLAGITVIMCLWALIEAFKHNDSKHTKTVITNSKGSTTTPKEIDELPSAYNSEIMQKFRTHPEVIVKSNDDLNGLKEELESVKLSYKQLQQQLTELKNKHTELSAQQDADATNEESLTELEKQRARQSPLLIPISSMGNDEKPTVNDHKKNSDDDIETSKVHYPKSKTELLAGSSIPAILQTQVVSDLPGTVVGIVRQNVYDSTTGESVLIPKGTRLIGSYMSNVVYGQDSLQVSFHRLIRPDGSSIQLSKFPGTSSMGTSGLGEDVNNHWGSIIGTSFLSAIFSIPAILASNSNTSNTCVIGTNANGSAIYGPCNGGFGNDGLKNSGYAVIQSLGQTASAIGNKLSSRALSRKPTVLIYPGYTFSVLVTKDLMLPPYK